MLLVLSIYLSWLMSIEREDEYRLSLAHPFLPGGGPASGLIWSPIDDATTFTAAAEASNEI